MHDGLNMNSDILPNVRKVSHQATQTRSGFGECASTCSFAGVNAHASRSFTSHVLFPYGDDADNAVYVMLFLEKSSDRRRAGSTSTHVAQIACSINLWQSLSCSAKAGFACAGYSTSGCDTMVRHYHLCKADV